MSQAPEDDDERTIVRPSSGRSGAQAPDVQPGHTLPAGTRIRDFEITGLIGEGGFGIVYLAYDHSLERRVAIKEYMPSSMASRVNGSATVVVKSDRHEETFKAGLKSFVNEARLLARFDHPALVKVYRFWEENGTAYMAMPYYEGPTLKSALAAMGRPPDETELRAWLRPLLDAMAVMHAAQCYHRDIAPDNILLTSTGPLLLDFGAARRVIGDMTHALTVVLKPGYAPIEQYGDVATMAQGAWTDLYALACVVYFAITGKVPMSSVERLMDDRLEPIARSAAGRYSPNFLQAIDTALAVRPQDRPQTDAQFRALLDGPDAASAPAGVGVTMPAADPVTRIIPAPARTAPTSAPMSGGAAPSAVQTATSVPPAPALVRTAAPTAAALPNPTAWPAAPPGAGRTTQPSALQSAPEALFGEAAPPARAPAEAASAPIESPQRAAAAGRAGAYRKPIYVAGGAVCVIALAAAALYFLQNRPAAESPAADSPAASAVGAPASTDAAASVAAPETAPAVPATATPAAAAPAPVAPAIAAPALVAPVPAAQAPEPAAAPAPAPHPAPVAIEAPAPVENRTTRRAAPSAEPESRATHAREAATEPAPPARPRREAPERAEPSPAAPNTPAPSAAVQSRCSDILQKASLEPLTAREAEFLKKECR